MMAGQFGRSTMTGKVAFSSFVGTAIEWYDFFAFGTAAALVFNKVFFPTLDPVVGTLSALGTFSAGFLARPLGGLIAGHYGDRLGRKGMLIATLVAMGVSTFLIGCLPIYATVGAWAPAMLIGLRLCQGLAVGGEWGGAVLMAMEHAPPGKRGLYASFAHVSAPVGGLLSTGVFSLVSRLPDEQFLSWGWRVPFLLSAIGLVAGLLIRVSITESPEFEKVKASGRMASVPLAIVLTRHWRTVLLSVGAKLIDGSTSYLMKVFLLSFAVKSYGVPQTVMLNAIMAASVVQLIAIPAFAALSDRLGRIPVYVFGALLVVVFAFPTFWMVETKIPVLVILGVSVTLGIAWSAMYGPQAAMFSELFDPEIRYNGASLGYQLSAVLGGGLSPVIATGLIAWAGGAAWPVSVYMIALAVVSVGCLFGLKWQSNAAMTSNALLHATRPPYG